MDMPSNNSCSRRGHNKTQVSPCQSASELPVSTDYKVGKEVGIGDTVAMDTKEPFESQNLVRTCRTEAL